MYVCTPFKTLSRLESRRPGPGARAPGILPGILRSNLVSAMQPVTSTTIESPDRKGPLGPKLGLQGTRFFRTEREKAAALQKDRGAPYLASPNRQWPRFPIFTPWEPQTHIKPQVLKTTPVFGVKIIFQSGPCHLVPCGCLPRSSGVSYFSMTGDVKSSSSAPKEHVLLSSDFGRTCTQLAFRSKNHPLKTKQTQKPSKIGEAAPSMPFLLSILMS